MNIEDIKKDREAIEILIKTQLKSLVSKYQLRDICVNITPECIGDKINSFEVKINISI